MVGHTKSFFLSLLTFLLLLQMPGRAFAQNTEQVEAIFRCESIPQLIQTFEWSGTRSTILQSMMRSIQNESLDSGFERQIISELQKKPWRINTIKELEAEFQVIKGQYKADLITEAQARLRMACELSKYLHRDYLENFDRASIFSPQSVPYAFYTYVRENELWRNLTNPDLDPETSYLDDPAIESTQGEDIGLQEDPFPANNPSPASNIDLLTILYWLFLILIGWIILSVISGYLLKNQRFTNPITRQVFDILLWPFRLIQPLLVERPPGEKKFFGLSQRAYGDPLSEEQLKLMIDNRIAETEKEEPPKAEEAPKDKRINDLQAQLDRLEKEQTTPISQPSNSDDPPPSAIDALQAKVDRLSQQLETLTQQLNTQKQEIADQQEDHSQTSQELSEFRKVLQEELGKYKKDIDNQLLNLSKTIATQTEEPEDEEEEEEYEEEPPADGGMSNSPGLNLEIETPDEEEETPEEDEAEEEEETPEESEEEISSAASDQLELTPLPAKDSPKQYIYYASSPQQGIFKGHRLEHGFIPKQTVYKITVDKENPEKASYTMVTHEPTIRLALNILDSYILPAMDLRGPGNIMEATDIGPVEAGELKKVEKDWHIVQKGVLHYS